MPAGSAVSVSSGSSRNEGDTKKASTLVTDKGRIERHIKPLLGRKRVGEISRSDVEKFMRDVAAGKTAIDEKTKKRGRAIVEGGKGTATRTVGLLGGIVRVDRDDADAECMQFRGIGGEPIADGLYVRTVVADEHHQQAVRAARAVQSVHRAIGAGQREVRGVHAEGRRR